MIFELIAHWKDSDIFCGLKVLVYASPSEHFIIGYAYDTMLGCGEDGDKYYTLTSLSDGLLIYKNLDKNIFAKYLTEQKFIPVSSYKIIFDKE